MDFKISQNKKEEVQRRMKTMECHGAVFAEPTVEFSKNNNAIWSEIAALIFKAAEKEEAVKLASDPKQEGYKPFDRLKDCVACSDYMMNDMQQENILDMYELRQD